MSGTNGRAFGSSVAGATMATNACRSVGEQIIRRNRISLFQDARESILEKFGSVRNRHSRTSGAGG